MIRSGRVSFHPSLEPLMVPIDSVHPAEWNYNNGDVDAIAESIHKYGMWDALKAQTSSREVIMGNHTWIACKELGSEIVPIVWMDVDDATARAAAIEDNEIARLAKPDRSQMMALVENIRAVTGDYLVSVTQRSMETLEALNSIPVRYDTGKNWPTLMIQVPPHVMKGFKELTREADTDTDAFELLLRLAGWEGEG